jgi:beta,beta-carotene 9',10'-dioxygenase
LLLSGGQVGQRINERLAFSGNFRALPLHVPTKELLEAALAEADRGAHALSSFGTDLKRNLFRRLIEPIPQLTDNTNVHVVPWQGKWLALTETPHQHVIDPETLRSEGLYEYADELPRALPMSAHPHYDPSSTSLVNVGVTYGSKSEVWILRQHKDSRARVVEGKLAFKRPPYIHSFGLTDKHAVLIDHPMTVNPLKLLFSNRSFFSHFAWQPERGTRLWKLERSTGKWTSYETEPLFCFHIVNTFEEGSDLVFDFLAFDDAQVVDALAMDVMSQRVPTIAPRFVRARLVAGRKTVELETLSDARFELPQINYRAQHGKRYSTAWGARLALGCGDPQWGSDIVKVGVGSGELLRYADEFTYGEPVFVPRPEGSREDDGVLLAVGSHPSRARTRLSVLDAHTLEPVAALDVGLSLPLGFHGSFAATHARGCAS